LRAMRQRREKQETLAEQDLNEVLTTLGLSLPLVHALDIDTLARTLTDPDHRALLAVALAEFATLRKDADLTLRSQALLETVDVEDVSAGVAQVLSLQRSFL
jgi:hypothetical protein